MKRLVALLLIGAAVLAPSAGAVTVKLDRTSVSTRIGEKFHFSSTLRNLE